MPNSVEGKMDDIFRNMAKGLTRKQRISVNKAGMELYKEKFKENFDESMDGRGKSIIETLTEDTTEGGAVTLGFSKKGKKAYLARFHNDGWVPRNQYGGPYKVHGGLPMVPGKHFWEKTTSDEALRNAISNREINKAKEFMSNKVHGGA